MKKMLILFLLFFTSLSFSQTRKDITIYRGDSTRIAFTIAKDFSARKLSFAIKANTVTTSSKLVWKRNSVNGGSATEISATYANGITTIYVYLSGVDTDDFTQDTYYYDLAIPKGSTDSTLAKGEVKLIKDVQTPFDGTDLPSAAVRYVAVPITDITDGYLVKRSGNNFIGYDIVAPLALKINYSDTTSNKIVTKAYLTPLLAAKVAYSDSLNKFVTPTQLASYSNTNAIKALINDSLDAFTKARVGLGSVDNTSDANKPVSSATQTALNAKADTLTTYTISETNNLLNAKVNKSDSTGNGYSTRDYVRTTYATLVSLNAKLDSSLAGFIKRGQWDAAYSALHSHSNKSTLDSVTTAFTLSLLGKINASYGWGNHAGLYFTKADSNTLKNAVTLTYLNTQLGNKVSVADSNTLSGYIKKTYLNSQLSGKVSVSDSNTYSGYIKRTYLETQLNGKQNSLGYTPVNVADSSAYPGYATRTQLNTKQASLGFTPVNKADSTNYPGYITKTNFATKVNLADSTLNGYSTRNYVRTTYQTALGYTPINRADSTVLAGGYATKTQHNTKLTKADSTLNGYATRNYVRTTFAPLISPSFTTPTLGVAIGTSLALNGQSLGSNKIAVNGDGDFNGTYIINKLWLGVRSSTALFSANGDLQVRSDSGSVGTNSTIRSVSANDNSKFAFDRINGSFARPTKLLANNIIGTIYSVGYDGTSPTMTHATQIEQGVTENWDATHNGSFIRLKTIQTASTSMTTAMYLSGRTVGIGTEAPKDITSGWNGLTLDGSNSGFLSIRSGSGVERALFYSQSGDLQINAIGASTNMKFDVNGATRVIFSTTGNATLGATASSGTGAFYSGSVILGATGSQFTQDITANKWTLKNDAGSPATLVTADSLGNMVVTGDASYSLRHAFLEKVGDYTPAVTQNVYLKMTPTFTTVEASNITVAGDSLTIVTPGAYYITFNATIRGANGDDFTVQLRKNNVSIKLVRVTTTGATNYQNMTLIYYMDGLVAGDDLSFYVTNTTNSNDPTFSDISVYTRKEHN